MQRLVTPDTLKAYRFEPSTGHYYKDDKAWRLSCFCLGSHIRYLVLFDVADAKKEHE